MKGAKKTVLLFGLLSLYLFMWVFVPPSLAQEEEGVKKEDKEEIQATQEPEKVVAAPLDIKESIGLWVFVVWMWISIAVLVYFLRLKIKETDRLYFLEFFSSDKK